VAPSLRTGSRALPGLRESIQGPGRVDKWEGGMVVFPKKVGFFSQTSASQSPNGTSRDLVFQEPLVSLPKAHPVFGGCRA